VINISFTLGLYFGGLWMDRLAGTEDTPNQVGGGGGGPPHPAPQLPANSAHCLSWAQLCHQGALASCAAARLRWRAPPATRAPLMLFVGAPFLWVQVRLRAQQLREALTWLGPSFIKAGQVLANRPDIVREDYMNELCVLQVGARSARAWLPGWRAWARDVQGWPGQGAAAGHPPPPPLSPAGRRPPLPR